MTCEEALSLVQNDFNRVITYSQGYSVDLNTTTLLKNWYDAKKRFIDAMGGKLIYETQETVNFELSQKEQYKKVSNFRDTLNDVYHNPELAAFLMKQKNGFFSNAVVEEYTTNGGTKIPKGMKLVKAFKFFESDPITLNEIQSEASRLIQENKVEGILCISVHPLDFLSASENTYNWRSCHALDGDYRSGNLSYMCDTNTVICYLKSAKGGNVRLPAFPPDLLWNSKKWRMLLYINTSNNCMFAGRQYPFFCNNALDLIKPIAIELFNLQSRYGWSAWHDDQITQYYYNNGEDNDYSHSYNNIIYINHRFHILNKFIKDESELHYNDLLKSSCYTPYYCWANDNAWEPMKIFRIGSKPVCPICERGIITYTDSLCCSDCYEQIDDNEDCIVGECEICGHTIYEDERCGTIDGLFICQHCMEEQTQECQCCHEQVLKVNNITYDPETHEYICQSCYVQRQRERGVTSYTVTATSNDEDWVWTTIDTPIPIPEDEASSLTFRQQVASSEGTVSNFEGVGITADELTDILLARLNRTPTTITAENSVWDMDTLRQYGMTSGYIQVDEPHELPF